MVSPLAFAALAKALTVDVRTRRLSVVGRSVASGSTLVGGCSGAVLAAIASASAGDGLLGFNITFTSLRLCALT